MAGVAVVTDSTAYLPRDWARRAGVEVVPVQVIVDGHPYDERDDEQAAQVTGALRALKSVTTSRPSPQRFTDAIAAAERAGADAVVIATLSAALSATHESAVLAARHANVDVRVVDSRTIAMGLGFAVLSGAAAAAGGGNVDEVEQTIRRAAEGSRVWFYVDTLEYLRRGGRIGSARAMLAQALQVKPLLTLTDGIVTPADRVRTASKALARLAELALANCPMPARIAVQHLDAPERAHALAAVLADLTGVEPVVGEVGGVAGAHVGPGTLAVITAPADPAADALVREPDDAARVDGGAA